MATETLKERAGKWQGKHGVAFYTYPGECRAEIKAFIAGWKARGRLCEREIEETIENQEKECEANTEEGA